MNTRDLLNTALHRVWSNRLAIAPIVLYLLFLLALLLAGITQAGIVDELAVLIDATQSDEAKQQLTESIEEYLRSPEFSFESVLGTVAIYLAVWFIVSLYLNCVLFITLAQLTRDRLNIWSTFREGFGFMPHFFGYKLAWTGLFLVTVTVGWGIALALYLLSPVVGIVSAVFSFFAVTLVLAYLFVRFLFPLPRIFMDEDAVISSFKTSYELTENRFWEAALVAVITIGLGALASTVLGNPVFTLLESIFGSAHVVTSVLSGVLGTGILLIYAFLLTVAELYRFLAYLEFQDG